MKTLISALVFVSVALAGPLKAVEARFPADQLKAVEQKWPTAQKHASGLRYIMDVEGTGQNVKRGDTVEVNYVGRLLNGQIFDKRDDPTKPLRFKIGKDNIIQGWEIGIQLMKKGGKLTLIVPSSLGYGVKGVPENGIGRDAVLIFEITLLNIK